MHVIGSLDLSNPLRLHVPSYGSASGHVARPIGHVCPFGLHIPSPSIFLLNRYSLFPNPSLGQIMRVLKEEEDQGYERPFLDKRLHMVFEEWTK